MGFSRTAVLVGTVIGVALLAVLCRPQETVRAADAPAAQPDLEQQYQTTIVPLLKQSCYECHGDGLRRGGIGLDSYKTTADVDAHRDQWLDLLKEVRGGEMPPPNAKHLPTLQDRTIIATWVENELFKIDPAHPDPGRVTIHRLNRAEYNNTVRDLVGVDFQPAEDFPSDDSGYGFDNVGDVMSLSPLLMEKYLKAANRIMDEAIVTKTIPSQNRHFNANLMEMGFNADGDRGDGWMPLGALEEDGVAETIPVPAGDYIVRVYAFVKSRGGGGGAGRAGGRGRTGAGAAAGGGAGRAGANANIPGGAPGAGGAAPGRGAAGNAADNAADANQDDAAVNDNANIDAANADVPPTARRGPGTAANAAAPTTQSQTILTAVNGAPTTQSGAVASAGGASAPQRPAAPAAAAGLKLALMIDGAVANDWDVSAPEEKPGTYEYRVGVTNGKHRFAVVNRRIRGGANELTLANGRVGRQQGGSIMVKWVEIEGPLPGATIRFPVDTLKTSGEGKTLPTGTRQLGHDGTVAASFTVPKAGEYILRAQAYADQAGTEPTRMEWRINGNPIKTFDVIAPGRLVPLQGQMIFSLELLKPMPYVYEMKVNLPAGPQEFSAAFTNDFSDPKATNPNLRQRTLYINYLEVVNPNESQPLPPMPAALASDFTVKPTPDTKASAAREILGHFTTRAWRRPVETGELDDLMKLFTMADKNGDSFEEAIKLPMKAVMVSPFFLFRGEVQSDPNDPKSVHPISEYSLASRLSYFLWSSMPDDELLNLAANNQLRQNLPAQVKRMLASPKAQGLVDNFSGQWLQTRNLDFVAPDKDLFPSFDANLRESMRKETQLFFNAVLREDRSVLDFLNGDYTFVNQRLAEFYGIKGVTGDEFQRVSLDGTPRRGVLTQASVLTITSNPTRTSPVKRGKWVLENLLNTPPPPPPPDVPPLANDGRPATGTLRQQMEQHRADPACASCHSQMDPLGFGLENFDAIGKWRDKDGKDPVDPSGKLATGEPFAGAVELENILADQRRDQFLNCIVEKMLTYGLGRGVEPFDRPAVEQILAGMKKDDLKFSSLIMEIVNSTPFEMCRGESPVAAAP